MTNIYALYRGEEFITEGTIKEIAKHQGIKPKSVEFYARPAYKKRTKGKNGKRLILIEKNIKKENYML